MRRQGGYAWILAAAVGLCLTGCASISELTAPGDPLLARLAEHLDRDDWRVDPTWSAGTDDDAYRWRFGRRIATTGALEPATPVETLLTEWNQQEPDNGEDHPLAVLSTRPGRIGWNAAILLARAERVDASLTDRIGRLATGDGAPMDAADSLIAVWDRLRSKADRSAVERVPAATRSAAAEIWCRRLAAGEGPMETRLDAPGRAWTRIDLPDEVRGELLRGLARHLPPERIVGFGELFIGGVSGAPVELRRAAIDGCVLFAARRSDRSFASKDWPGTIESARFDVDASVRRGYGRWAALSRHPEAVSLLSAQVQDVDVPTAVAAIESLGLLRTESAREALRVISAKPADLFRAAAAGSLATWGPQELKGLMADDSAHVRRAAVEAFGRCPSPEAALALDSVIADGDLDVQRRAVEATADWPDDLALPILLDGLCTSSLRTRRECLDEIRRRTGYAAAFPVAGDHSERSAAVREAATKEGWPLDGLTRFRLARSETPGGTSPSPADKADPVLARLLAPTATSVDQEKAFDELRAIGSAGVSAVEAFCLEHPGPVSERLMVDVLPTTDAAHAALQELASGDVSVRRRGAGRLAELGRAATLSPLVLRRIRGRLAQEPDGLIWRQVMAAIASDATPDAEQLALLALNNAWPDVRRLGCEYVGRHHAWRRIESVLPLVSDESDSVRLAAIEAIGLCGETAGLDAVNGLRAAAAGADQAARFAAIAALARIGDEPGTAALLRWAEYEAPSERIKAVRAIAATGRRWFEPDLARLAQMEKDPLVRRELLAALEGLVPPGRWPDGADAGLPDDRIRAWASRREGQTSTMRSPDAVTGVSPAASGTEPEPPHVSRAVR